MGRRQGTRTSIAEDMRRPRYLSNLEVGSGEQCSWISLIAPFSPRSRRRPRVEKYERSVLCSIGPGFSTCKQTTWQSEGDVTHRAHASNHSLHICIICAGRGMSRSYPRGQREPWRALWCGKPIFCARHQRVPSTGVTRDIRCDEICGSIRKRQSQPLLMS